MFDFDAQVSAFRQIIEARTLAEAKAIAVRFVGAVDDEPISRVVKSRKMGAEAFHRAYQAAVKKAGGVTFADPLADWPMARTYKYTDELGRVATIRLPAQMRVPAPHNWATGQWPECLVVNTAKRSTAAEVSARFDAIHATEHAMWAMIRGETVAKPAFSTRQWNRVATWFPLPTESGAIAALKIDVAA